MQKGQPKATHQKLYVIFGILVVIIVALSIAIAIVVTNANNSEIAKDAEYYQNLASEIMFEDTDRVKGEEAITYAIMADDLDQSIDSATFVLNTASTYYLIDIHNQYLEILKERQIKNGVDLSTEGVG